MNVARWFGALEKKYRAFRRALRLRRKRKQYVYGLIHSPEDRYTRHGVRLNLKTRQVEFRLWKPGEQGHRYGYWHPMGLGWEKHFIPYKQKGEAS